MAKMNKGMKAGKMPMRMKVKPSTNDLSQQKVIGGSLGGPTGSSPASKNVPITDNKMSKQKVVGSEGEVTS